MESARRLMEFKETLGNNEDRKERINVRIILYVISIFHFY